MAVEEAAFVNEGGWWSSRAMHTRDILLRQLQRPAGTPVLVRHCRSSSLGTPTKILNMALFMSFRVILVIE